MLLEKLLDWLIQYGIVSATMVPSSFSVHSTKYLSSVIRSGKLGEDIREGGSGRKGAGQGRQARTAAFPQITSNLAPLLADAALPRGVLS